MFGFMAVGVLPSSRAAAFPILATYNFTDCGGLGQCATDQGVAPYSTLGYVGTVTANETSATSMTITMQWVNANGATSPDSTDISFHKNASANQLSIGFSMASGQGTTTITTSSIEAGWNTTGSTANLATTTLFSVVTGNAPPFGSAQFALSCGSTSCTNFNTLQFVITTTGTFNSPSTAFAGQVGQQNPSKSVYFTGDMSQNGNTGNIGATSAPEPASLALFAAGRAGLAAVRRRWRRNESIIRSIGID